MFVSESNLVQKRQKMMSWWPVHLSPMQQAHARPKV